MLNVVQETNVPGKWNYRQMENQKSLVKRCFKETIKSQRCKQSKKNMCLDSIKLFIVCVILCATVETCITYTTVITRSLFLSYNQSLFCSQPFGKHYLLFVSSV